MATRNRNRLVTLPADDDENPEPAQHDEPLAEFEPDVERFLVERAEGVSGATVKVYRAATQNAPGKGSQVRDVWLYQCPPDEFTEEVLQANYGAGAYRIKLYGTAPDANGRPKYMMLVNRLIEIGAPMVTKRDPSTGALAGVTINATGGGAVEIARAVTDALAPVLAALAQQNAGGGRKAFLEEMQIMSAMLRPAVAPADGKAQLLDALSLAEKLSDLKSDGEGDSGAWKALRAVIDKFGEPIGAAISNMVAKGGTPPAASATALPAPLAGAQPPVQLDQDQSMNIMLGVQLAMILAGAEGNEDHDFYAEMIYRKAPDEVIATLNAPDWFEKLCGLEPKFATHRAWCEKVRAEVLRALREDDTLDGQTASAAPVDVAGAK